MERIPQRGNQNSLILYIHMNIPDHIFRAYDIRGFAAGDNIEITPDFARDLAKATVAELSIDKPRIAVGRDNRLSGDELAKAFNQGLEEAGAEVIYIDYATSPYLYFVVCNEKLDGGVNITASHNPPDYNGFKIVGTGALPIDEDQIKNLRKRLHEKDYADHEGGSQNQANFHEAYFEKLKELAPLGRKLKVVIDCGNGAAGYFAQDFFREMGCEVVELYCEPDGNFPNHMPNPEDSETLVDLQKKVLEEKADLGIAFDGDGDRVGIVDEVGKVVTPDWLLILLARDLLSRNPGSEIIFEVKCSNVLAAEIEKLGGTATRWKTGHSFIKRKMKETGALLAGEISGHIFFKENYFGVDDGLLAAAKIVSIVSQSDKKISEHFADIPPTHTTPEIKIGVDDEVKFDVVKKIVEDFEKEFENTETLDGVRVSFDDHAWGLIRASNTSPYLTSRFEAGSEERLNELKSLFKEKLSKYPELDISGL
jgi:phosphomannomutase/phosphoglucomutase